MSGTDTLVTCATAGCAGYAGCAGDAGCGGYADTLVTVVAWSRWLR